MKKSKFPRRLGVRNAGSCGGMPGEMKGIYIGGRAICVGKAR